MLVWRRSDQSEAHRPCGPRLGLATSSSFYFGWSLGSLAHHLVSPEVILTTGHVVLVSESQCSQSVRVLGSLHWPGEIADLQGGNIHQVPVFGFERSLEKRFRFGRAFVDSPLSFAMVLFTSLLDGGAALKLVPVEIRRSRGGSGRRKAPHSPPPMAAR